jgi:hypothetical protein
MRRRAIVSVDRLDDGAARRSSKLSMSKHSAGHLTERVARRDCPRQGVGDEVRTAALAINLRLEVSPRAEAVLLGEWPLSIRERCFGLRIAKAGQENPGRPSQMIQPRIVGERPHVNTSLLPGPAPGEQELSCPSLGPADEGRLARSAGPAA